MPKNPGTEVLVFTQILTTRADKGKGENGWVGVKQNWNHQSNWVADNFGGADLGDVRRNQRLLTIANVLSGQPHGNLHRMLPDWNDAKAAYEFLKRPEVTFEAVGAAHRKWVRRACAQPGDYLLISDTTTLDYSSHPCTSGLGRVGDNGGLGLFLHSTLAVRVEEWDAGGAPLVQVLGMAVQKCWARTMPTIGAGKEKKAKRLARPRESERWAEAVKTLEYPPPGARWTHVADREADIYEVFETCLQTGSDWIVRANQRRALSDEDGSIFDAVARRLLLGTKDIELRARPGQAARTARVEVRAGPVNLRGPWRPEKRTAPLSMNAVEIRETNPPVGVEPLHWVLLTSWPVDSLEAAWRVAQTYARRWMIEEYHKALKSGANVEQSQLENGSSLQALIGILSVVAVRLFALKYEARTNPDAVLTKNDVDPIWLIVLGQVVSKPPQVWTRRTLLHSIASLGGFKGRKGDGDPGWQSTWWGWQRLMLLTQGFAMATTFRFG